jgi:hypothetical protein
MKLSLYVDLIVVSAQLTNLTSSLKKTVSRLIRGGENSIKHEDGITRIHIVKGALTIVKRLHSGAAAPLENAFLVTILRIVVIVLIIPVHVSIA